MNAVTRTPMTLTGISASNSTASGVANAPSGGGCGCCTPQQATPAPPITADAVTAEYSVIGLTCGSCSARVSGALSTLDGVQDVQIALVPGGMSTVRITGVQNLTRISVQDAVEMASYQLTSA